MDPIEATIEVSVETLWIGGALAAGVGLALGLLLGTALGRRIVPDDEDERSTLDLARSVGAL